MTRLLTVPKNLADRSTAQPDPARVATLAELRALRAALSLCAGRMVPTSASIAREVGRIEQIVVELRELASRL